MHMYFVSRVSFRGSGGGPAVSTCCEVLVLASCEGVGIAQLIERRIRDRRVAGSIPTGVAGLFFSLQI